MILSKCVHVKNPSSLGAGRGSLQKLGYEGVNSLFTNYLYSTISGFTPSIEKER
jgi:hypothetical protein